MFTPNNRQSFWFEILFSQLGNITVRPGIMGQISSLMPDYNAI
jgi:hypothetical protein